MTKKTNKVSAFATGVSTEWKQIRWPKQGLLIKQTAIITAATAFIVGLCALADAGAFAFLGFIH